MVTEVEPQVGSTGVEGVRLEIRVGPLTAERVHTAAAQLRKLAAQLDVAACGLSARDGDESSLDFTAPRILLVEDSDTDAEFALQALAAAGVANEIVVHVHDGDEALDFLYRAGRFASAMPGHPAVVLLDLHMPKVNGFEFLERIKADPKLKPIPVVCMSASRNEEDVLWAYRLGANAYIVKPNDYTGFMDAVREFGEFWGTRNVTPHV